MYFELILSEINRNNKKHFICSSVMFANFKNDYNKRTEKNFLQIFLI